jgi:hypothetical protein
LFIAPVKSFNYISSMNENFSPAFVEGFVKSCLDQGLNMPQTEALFRQHSFNYLLSSPNIYKGFQTKLASYTGPLTKSAMSRFLTPAILALAAECRVKYANDALSIKLRKETGLPDPSWETVDPELQKIANSLSGALSSYAGLPMNQKILLAALAGSGVGGLSRLARPSEEDQIEGRGAMSRTLRGAGRGAVTGAGAGVGSEVGGLSGLEAAGSKGVLPGMLLGAGAGGYAAHRLTS